MYFVKVTIHFSEDLNQSTKRTRVTHPNAELLFCPRFILLPVSVLEFFYITFTFDLIFSLQCKIFLFARTWYFQTTHSTNQVADCWLIKELPGGFGVYRGTRMSACYRGK